MKLYCMRGNVAVALSLLLLLMVASACNTSQEGPPESRQTPSATHTGGERAARGSSATDAAPVLVGAGDIATCSGRGDEATARLLDAVFAAEVEGVVFTAGDNAYEKGTLTQFEKCYNPTWGRHKTRTRPAVGNHEYLTDGAAGHFDYFNGKGAMDGPAGRRDQGYYSYDLGDWHIIVLNSNCSKLGGCQPGSPQYEWLRADLAATDRLCTAAYWHHPLFSSGRHGNFTTMRPMWELLYEHDVDVVLAGHDHVYERFAPQDASGKRDDQRGIRQFTVGTGGRSHTDFRGRLPNSEVRNADTYGVLKLTLYPDSYDWEFIPEEGKSFTDSGHDECH